MNARTGSGAGWFLFQRVSGLLLAALLLFHFVLMHFSGAELTEAVVNARLVSNLYRVVDLSFLGLALGHGCYGAWMVAADYLQHPYLRVAALVASAVIGLFLSILGAITVLAG